AQDARAVAAVEAVKDSIAAAVRVVVAQLKANGRLLYFGAGTSGRLGVLDASECPPTFRTDPEMVQGIMAGGPEAMFKAKEGAEDSAEQGAATVDEKNVGPHDVVMGIAAGGTTPFVHGALRRAAERGAKTIFLSCVQPVPTEPKVDVVIRPLTGPEVVTGSTRLKAGTATKLVLNMLTTLSMVQMNKVYENLMVDLKATNTKLWDRAARIISIITSLPREQSMDLLKKADGHVKVAIVMHRRNLAADDARALLDRHHGRLRDAVADRGLEGL
ncbi:MAG: N-acetylmuramic acid 6-phosphate etherase, partial [Tepidisphaeraceae bacterium]